MEMPMLNGGHLDIFKEMRRAESTRLATKTLFPGVDVPEHIGVNFDFENKVVILLNKKT
jgi:hypothetical protein